MIAQSTRKTRFRLPASSTGREFHPQGPFERFQRLVTSLILLSHAFVAQGYYLSSLRDLQPRR